MMRTSIRLVSIAVCILLAAGAVLGQQHYFAMNDHMSGVPVEENTRQACLEKARSYSQNWQFGTQQAKFDCTYVGAPPPLPFLIYQPYGERIGPYDNWQDCERQAELENALSDRSQGLYKTYCTWRQPDFPDVPLYFPSLAGCQAEAARQKADATVTRYYAPECSQIKSDNLKPGESQYALTLRVKDKETPSFIIEPDGVPDLMSPNWTPFPHLDEHPCNSDNECSSGLKCQESKFDINSGEMCSFDYQCLLPAVHFRNMRLQLVGHCWGNHCTYRPAQWRWCLHRRQLSDPPVYSDRRCARNFDCASGQSCLTASATDHSRHCGYLPAIVWPPGTKLDSSGMIEFPCWMQPKRGREPLMSMLAPIGRFGSRLNIQAASPCEPGAVSASAAPLPKNFPQTWDIRRGRLPAAPPGYVWMLGSELSNGRVWHCQPMGRMEPSASYSATTYVLSDWIPNCFSYIDQEHFNQDLNESMTFPPGDFDAPCGASAGK